MNSVSEVVLNGAIKKVTRLEVIDYTNCDACAGKGYQQIAGQSKSVECPACHGGGFTGREVIFFDSHKEIELSLQDDRRTLKIFINERTE